MAESKINNLYRNNSYGERQQLTLNQMTTFNSDGYVYLSCSNSSSSTAQAYIYGASGNDYMVVSAVGGNSYPNSVFFVRKGMRIKPIDMKNNGVVLFVPLSGGV